MKCRHTYLFAGLCALLFGACTGNFRDINDDLSGITDGELLPGVKFRGNKAVSYSLATRLKTKTIRHIQAEHNLRQKTIPSKTLSKEQLV